MEDFLSQAGGNRNSITSPLSLSLATLGNTDFDSLLSVSPLLQGHHKIHESTCEYYNNIIFVHHFVNYYLEQYYLEFMIQFRRLRLSNFACQYHFTEYAA